MSNISELNNPKNIQFGIVLQISAIVFHVINVSVFRFLPSPTATNYTKRLLLCQALTLFSTRFFSFSFLGSSCVRFLSLRPPSPTAARCATARRAPGAPHPCPSELNTRTHAHVPSAFSVYPRRPLRWFPRHPQFNYSAKGSSLALWKGFILSCLHLGKKCQ